VKIFVYGDSNTFGQIPNIDGYSKNAAVKRYEPWQMWWHPLTAKHEVIVNGWPGRAINNENPWRPGCRAMATIKKDIEGVEPDVVIIQLGTNDCKSEYGLLANEIVDQLKQLIDVIKNKCPKSKFVVLSPAKIVEGNKITDKYYKGAEKKSQELDVCYERFCSNNGYIFVSGVDLPVGEDGEHLTEKGHAILAQRVEKEIEINEKDLNEK